MRNAKWKAPPGPPPPHLLLHIRLHCPSQIESRKKAQSCFFSHRVWDLSIRRYRHRHFAAFSSPGRFKTRARKSNPVTGRQVTRQNIAFRPNRDINRLGSTYERPGALLGCAVRAGQRGAGDARLLRVSLFSRPGRDTFPVLIRPTGRSSAVLSDSLGCAHQLAQSRPASNDLPVGCRLPTLKYRLSSPSCLFTLIK